MEELSFIVYEIGHEKINYVIATYHDDDSKKDFIIYTDKTINSDGKLNIYYSLYKMENGSILLIETTDIKDKRIGLNLIKSISKFNS